MEIEDRKSLLDARDSYRWLYSISEGKQLAKIWGQLETLARDRRKWRALVDDDLCSGRRYKGVSQVTQLFLSIKSMDQIQQLTSHQWKNLRFSNCEAFSVTIGLDCNPRYDLWLHNCTRAGKSSFENYSALNRSHLLESYSVFDTSFGFQTPLKILWNTQKLTKRWNKNI